MSGRKDRYKTTYSSFTSELSARIRSEVFGEDIGQNSWTTAKEQIGFAEKSGLRPGSHLLEVGCGSGGPALFLARTIGLTITGADINEAGIIAANTAADAAGLADRAKFICLDCGGKFPFASGSFDAVQLIDAINHIPDRMALLTELHRLLRSGGTLLYTDPVVVTGAVSSEEIAARSSIGFFLFMPEGENERMLKQCGFEFVGKENVTSNAAAISAGWITAREKWRQQLIESEGLESYKDSLRFSHAVHTLSSSGRLSRYMYLARKL